MKVAYEMVPDTSVYHTNDEGVQAVYVIVVQVLLSLANSDIVVEGLVRDSSRSC